MQDSTKTSAENQLGTYGRARPLAFPHDWTIVKEESIFSLSAPQPFDPPPTSFPSGLTMASKRKSTTPCMIPSKVIRSVEEAERDSLVPLRHSRVPGGDRRSPLDASGDPNQEAGDADKDGGGGTYTCKLCNFETHDLNLFLDHVYTGHPDFRADPGFVCMSCGVSAPKFEGLALHNARVHPSTLNTTLQLRRRERRVVVEQNLVIGAELCRDSEISITKTPIMRMLKGKSEPKRIVVSHSVSDEPASDVHPASISRESERKESSAVTVTHVSTIVHNGTSKTTLPSAIQIVNGSTGLPLLKTPITQVVSVAQNRSLHHSAPITASSTASSASSSSSSQNLPKVMIPLSSIPTYSASMDSSSFLKTSFSKFPYPTKAELCYLTVVTKFPEEQIKIWFTAQRLKQGISWSPEEIEDARRKMFNTIIQTAPVSSQNQTQSHHSPAPHTITVLPASLGPTGIPQFLQGSLVSPGGVIVTQPVVANGIQVSSAPVALAVTPKPQAAARPTMQARPAAALVADKSPSMLVGTVGSSKAVGGGTNSTSNTEGGVINLSLGSSSHSNTKGSSVNGKHGSANANSSEKNSNDVSSRASARNTDSKPGGGGNGDGGGSGQMDSKTPTENKAVISSCENLKSKDANGSSNHHNLASAGTEEADPSGCDSPTIKMEDASSPTSKSSSPTPAGPGCSSGSRTPSSTFLDPIFYKGKKSQEQLSTLKDSFLVSQWPDQEEVDRLIGLTGLTVREVRKWFSDRRYHFRNCKSSRSSTGGQSKPSAGAGNGGGTPGSSAAGCNTPVDLSESSSSNSGAKTPQHSSSTATQSPPPTQTPTSPSAPSKRLFRLHAPDFTAVRYKERDPHQVIALEASFAQNTDPSGEEVDRLRSETKMTRREIHGWFAEKRKRVAAEKKKEEAEREPKEDEEMEVDGEERQRDDGSGEPKVNPIKINLKMLKKTSHSPKPATVRGKKTAEQLHLLKQVYARTQWPSATQYDELISGTGLPRPEVVRWFGDSRYVQKNGLLKWLEEYQNLALEEELQRDGSKVLQDHLDAHGRLDDSQLKKLAEKTGLTSDLVRHWFSTRGANPDAKQSAAQRGGTEAIAAEEAAAPPTGSSALEPQPGGGTNEKTEQSVCGSEADADSSAAAAGSEEASV
ncbi:zinc fingers and homeoboxes protein 3 isoform X2 [Poeciliopsis prolifica]|uniref:zinc fingers and homeoboxes protein 3 isoform X2 n=1 Tax=Poeciliopsis prolifica TaxID=188132 RepID=UPI0024134B67|nr:zinc fingers and homeoboxes protein 3 isoform X2 [Poeciliopsis prolifica]